jgi:hypothetical protein
MIDVKQPIRKAFYDLLQGHLTYGNAVLAPVVDDMKALGDTSQAWVLLSSQDGVDASSFQTFDSTETIVLDITFKAATRANKNIVDAIAGQILPLVLPAPGVNGLVPNAAVQLSCVKVSDDRYITLGLNTSNSVIRRLITFKMHCRQTGSTTPVTPIPAFQNPVVSADFAGNPTTYINANLKGKSFLLYMNGIGFLTEGVQWQPATDGGFQILINNFDSTKNSYTFYVLLQ